ncbi:amidohydrolase [Isobaculum melis]|uniref:Amidohydrolase 3 domain-containing protein n=1 Tax=Isobaculum melis TaxID=142588 RepID=A0A1H9RKP7_9LACT|nr:amidohydrolase [Isobaculum melis]SER73330.1 hypothetical protein SAMN04488559_104126 [Isobaculum melis]
MKLWKNGLFYTMEQAGKTVEAVLSDKGMIVATGAVEMLRAKWSAQIQEEIDLKGQVAFPGFVDSHLHILWYGQALSRLNLSQVKSKKEALTLIEQRVKELAPEEWLFVEGYNENMWTDEQTLFTKEDLDGVSFGHPVIVRRIDYHCVTINTAYIEAIGLKDQQVFAGGGEIVLTAEGLLTGILKDEATNLAIDAFPMPTQKELESLIQLAIKDLWSKGLTGGHSEDLHYFNGFIGTLAAYRSAIDQEKTPFRAHLLIHHEELAAYSASGEKFVDGDPFVELGAMKIFYDGTVGSRTALMTQPYADNPANYGLQIHADASFEAMVINARKAGLPIAVHILGDAAFEKVLTMVQKYPPKAGQRDRMIHTPWLTDALIEQAKGLPLMFDIQPQFMSSDLPWALDILGEHYPQRAFAWKSLLEAGLLLAGGSDAPIEIPNPFYGIYSAVTRKADADQQAYFKEQALSVYEAISLYTIGSSVADYKETTRGKIAPGFICDLTVVKEDPFRIPVEQLKDTKVAMTVVNEQIVFEQR